MTECKRPLSSEGGRFCIHFNPFNQVPENIPVYVPCNTLADYQAAEGWNAFTNLIDPCATVTQTIELSQGWNWVSIYIEGEPEELLDMLKTGLGDNALSIEGTEGVIEYIGDGYWFGDEFGIANETMYLIDVVTACTVELQGLPANPSDHEIEINPNDWNWIGYPCNEELLVEVALSGYEPEIGDIIESNTDGVVEYVGVWYGDFDTLKPGRGYMYYSASGESKTLVFQTERSKAKAKSGFFSGKTSKMSIERKVESWD